MNRPPKVTVISLGGTISSTTAESSGLAVPRLSAADLVAAVPQLATVADIEVIDLARLPSVDLSFALGRSVAAEVLLAAGRGADGVVITQGTDTIEEMSFLLDLIVDSDIAVVVTGAMRHASTVGADGPANVLDAVRVAASPNARGLGCLVVFNGEVHSGRTVRKTHTASVGTFRSEDVGPVGWVVEGKVALRDRPYPRLVVRPPVDAEIVNVALVKVVFDDDGWWLPTLVESNPPGLVVEAMGGGHIPAHLADRIIELAGRVPVVLTSRTGRGPVLTSTYGGFAGSESALIAGGLIPGGTLNGLQARILLGVLLSAGYDHERIAGAIASVGRLHRGSDSSDLPVEV